MSLLPTAHAAQSFGARRIDFFAVPGRVVGARGKAGAGERRIQDFDGMTHEVRLMDRAADCTSGDDATVLRVQSGPNRRSRAVAVIDHTENAWHRCSPDATSILARAGVTRAFNWWLSMVAFIAVAALAVWPDLHRFFTELNAGVMANVPSFSIYDDLTERFPALAGWGLEGNLPAALRDALASTGFVPMDQLTVLGAGIAGAILALMTFSARSWRLIYVPAFLVFAVMAGAVTGGADITLALVGVISVLFLVGGFINRLRDGGRFNARVERLADYVLRNPPQEGVIATASAVAAAPAVEDPPVQGEPQAEAAPFVGEETESELTDGEAEAAPAAGDAVNGETALEVAEAPAAEALAEEPPAAEETASAPAETETVLAEEPAAAESAAEETPAAEAVEEAAEPAPALAEEAVELDDDLPDDAALAAAAALNAAEQASEDGDVETAAEEPRESLEDERTMPLAPPPPMPEPAEESAAEPVVEAAPALEEAPVEEAAVEETQDAAPEPAQDVAPEFDIEPAAEPEPRADLADEIDPVVDSERDPMLDAETADPFAPGAPELEISADPDAEPQR
jgi:hypothetical protein